MARPSLIYPVLQSFQRARQIMSTYGPVLTFLCQSADHDLLFRHPPHTDCRAHHDIPASSGTLANMQGLLVAVLELHHGEEVTQL